MAGKGLSALRNPCFAAVLIPDPIATLLSKLLLVDSEGQLLAPGLSVHRPLHSECVGLAPCCVTSSRAAGKRAFASAAERESC